MGMQDFSKTKVEMDLGILFLKDLKQRNQLTLIIKDYCE